MTDHDYDRESTDGTASSVPNLHELDVQLAEAINVRDIEAIKAALANGADPSGKVEERIGAGNDQDFPNYPISMFSRLSGADQPQIMGITSLLIGAGLDLAQESLHELGPDDAMLMKLMIEGGADVNELGYQGMRPLHTVKCKGGVQMLLQGGADLTAVDDYGRTALHTNRDPWSVSELIEAGADLNARDAFSMTPIQSHEDGSCRNALRIAGADLIDTDRIAALCPPDVRVEPGLDASLRMELVVSPNRAPRLMNVREDAAPPPDDYGSDGYYGNSSEPIDQGFSIMLSSDVAKRDRFLEYLTSREGQDVLMRASASHSGESVGTYASYPECRSVMKYMCNPQEWENISVRNQGHILDFATSDEETPWLNRELAANGLSIHAQLGELILLGGTASNMKAQYLIDQGADLENLSADTVVELANRSTSDSLTVLIEHGMSANAVSENGDTPLHVMSSVSKAEILLGHGADPLAKNALGQLPYEAIQQLRNAWNMEPVVDYLRAASEAAEMKRLTQAAAGAWSPDPKEADAQFDRRYAETAAQGQGIEPQQQRSRMRL